MGYSDAMWGEGAVSIANNVGPLPNALSFASVVAVRPAETWWRWVNFAEVCPLCYLDLQKVTKAVAVAAAAGGPSPAPLGAHARADLKGWEG